MVKYKFIVVVERNVKKVRLNLRVGTCANFEYANATKSRGKEFKNISDFRKEVRKTNMFSKLKQEYRQVSQINRAFFLTYSLS